MTDPGDRLNRLAIGEPCSVAWEEMAGSGAHRYCHECQRQVVDFAQLTPRQIEARLRIARGTLCARLTRRDGLLVTAPEQAPPAAARNAASLRRPAPLPALAAGVLTAFLGGVGAGSAAGNAKPDLSASPAAATNLSRAADAAPATAADASLATAGGASPTAAPDGALPAASRPTSVASRAIQPGGASIVGHVIVEDGTPADHVLVVARNDLDGHETTARSAADGSFVFHRLASGIYTVSGEKPGYESRAQALLLRSGDVQRLEVKVEEGELCSVGGISSAPSRLRTLFASSDLVITATVGGSRVVSRDEHAPNVAEVITELFIDSTLKGAAHEPAIWYSHYEAEPVDGSPAEWHAAMPPGSSVLAMLQCNAGKACHEPGTPFVETSVEGSVQNLDHPKMAALLDHLQDLANLNRQATARGSADAAALLEWTVGATEDPLTRAAAYGDLMVALQSLDSLADRLDQPVEAFGASLRTAAQQFLAGGGSLSQRPPEELIGALLTASQRARLTRALAAASSLEEGAGLVGLIRRWDEPAATAWLLARLTGNSSSASTPRNASSDADDELSPWRMQLQTLANVALDMDNESLDAVSTAAFRRLSEIADDPGPATPEAHAARDRQLDDIVAGVHRDFVKALQAPPPG